MTFRYYIVSVSFGVRGTNSMVVAKEFAELGGFLVIDTDTREVLKMNDECAPIESLDTVQEVTAAKKLYRL